MSEHTQRPRIAVFRPDDERLTQAIQLLEAVGFEAVADPMLAVEATGKAPEVADYLVFTSKTGVEEAIKAGWEPAPETIIAAIGERTAEALSSADIEVDRLPETYSSTGLVERLEGEVAGHTVEVARSDHGSDVLIDGLEAAGATVNETVLYRLVKPTGAGHSTTMAAEGRLEGALFTSSLTVEHFIEAARERSIEKTAIEGLDEATVGAIGHPTATTARSAGIDVDVVPEMATFEALVSALEAALDTSRDH